MNWARPLPNFYGPGTSFANGNFSRSTRRCVRSVNCSGELIDKQFKIDLI